MSIFLSLVAWEGHNYVRSQPTTTDSNCRVTAKHVVVTLPTHQTGGGQKSEILEHFPTDRNGQKKTKKTARNRSNRHTYPSNYVYIARSWVNYVRVSRFTRTRELRAANYVFDPVWHVPGFPARWPCARSCDPPRPPIWGVSNPLFSPFSGQKNTQQYT